MTKIYHKPINKIRKGEIVAGDNAGWWRVDEVDIDENESVVLKSHNMKTGQKGWLQGRIGDIRDLVTDD